MNDKVLGVVWKPNLDTVIGIVAVETFENKWQAYMGVCKPNKTKEYVIGKVIAWGAILTAEEAHGFFPQLDIARYKGYAKPASTERVLFEGLTPLKAPVPPMLEKAIGYNGDARFVSFHWTPGGDEAFYDDGWRGGIGNWQGYLAFIQHPTVHPMIAQYNLGSSDREAQQSLILDRQTRKLYVSSRRDTQSFLDQQWPKLGPIHMTQEEWSALQAEARMYVKQDIDMEEIHRRIEEQYALVEALQDWLNQFLPN